MFRYVACVFDETDPAQTALAKSLSQRFGLPEWASVLSVRGLQIFCADWRLGSSEVNILQQGRGAVLGTVFESCDEHAKTALPKKVFPASQSLQIVKSGCRHLVDHGWGRYVAFAHDESLQKSYVLRDPTGGLPCYRMPLGGLHIIFSNVEDIVGLGIATPSVDPEYIAARAVLVFMHGRSTALREVTEVLPGEHLEFHHGILKQSFAWDPLQIARTDILEDADVASIELRRVAKSCIHSWAACYDSILHRLSGGLDSSIVLGCLQDAPTHPALTCLNYYSAGHDSDERHYANIAANHASIELIEQERGSALRVENLLNIRRSVAPTMYLGPLQSSKSEARLARETGAGAYFGGNGGDQLFYQSLGALSVADYVQTHGVNRRLLEVALDAAHLEKRSIWQVLRQAFGHRKPALIDDSKVSRAAQRTLMNEDAIAAVLGRNTATHPLFESSRGTPPGKFLHAYGLSMPPEFYDPLGAPGDPEPVQPLLSQPLIELCLRIPTYVLTNSGWDRALARRAFRDDVPREILQRRSKGGVEQNAKQILMNNLQAARDLLLDGELVQLGLLDRNKLDEVLSDRPTRTAGAVSEVFDHLSTEAWLRRWKSAAIH